MFGVLNTLVSLASFLPIIIVGPIADVTGPTVVIMACAAIVGGTALLMIAASGIALARHESSAKAHPGVVGLKEAILVAMIVLLGGHAYVRGRNARLAASALMLVLTLAAILAGAWLTQS